MEKNTGKLLFIHQINDFSSHSVGVLLLQLAQFAPEVDFDLEVEVPLVAIVGLHGEHAVELLALLAGDVIFQIKHGLLPVSVGGFGGG